VASDRAHQSRIAYDIFQWFGFSLIKGEVFAKLYRGGMSGAKELENAKIRFR
jgi:hypothetical protein